MNRIFLSTLFLIFSFLATAQSRTPIYGDSVTIRSRNGSAEFILENRTKDTAGFLFNIGKGKTVFKRALIRINDTTYLIGPDTLRIKSGSSLAYTAGFGTKINGTSISSDTAFVLPKILFGGPGDVLMRKEDGSYGNGRMDDQAVYNRGNEITDSVWVMSRDPQGVSGQEIDNPGHNFSIGKGGIGLDSANLRIYLGRWQYQDRDSSWKNFSDGSIVDISGKVDKRNGFDLSSNDYTTVEKQNVALIPGKVDYLADIPTLQGYTGNASALNVLDTVRGGILKPIASGFVDNGNIFQDGLGRKWRRIFDNITLDASHFGAVADGDTTGIDGAISIGSSVFTSASKTFTTDDNGKIIFISGAGASGGVLIANITAIISPTSVNLSTVASVNVTNAKFTYGTNSTTALDNMNKAARRMKGKGVVWLFKPGTGAYLYQHNNWASGIRKQDVRGNGAHFICTNGAYPGALSSYSSTCDAFNLSAAWNDGDTAVGNESAHRQVFGDRIYSTTNKTNLIRLMDKSQISKYKVGDWVMPWGLDRGNVGNHPPISTYFEYARIKSVDTASGSYTTTNRLKNYYSQDWMDSTWQGDTTGLGAARVLDLNRGYGNFDIIESFTMSDCIFDPFPQSRFNDDNHNGRCMFYGIINASISNSQIPACYFGNNKNITFTGDNFTGYLEPDQQIEFANVINCNIGEIGGGGGISNGLFRGNYFSDYTTLAAMSIRIEDNIFAGRSGNNSNAFADLGNSDVVILGTNYVLGDSTRQYLFSKLGTSDLTIDSLIDYNSTTSVGNVMVTLNHYNTAKMARQARPGRSGKTAAGKVATINTVGRYATGKVVYNANFSTAPAVGDVFKFNYVQRVNVQGAIVPIGPYRASVQLMADTSAIDTLTGYTGNIAPAFKYKTYKLVQQATQAEASAGVNDDKYMTPKTNLKVLVDSLVGLTLQRILLNGSTASIKMTLLDSLVAAGVRAELLKGTNITISGTTGSNTMNGTYTFPGSVSMTGFPYIGAIYMPNPNVIRPITIPISATNGNVTGKGQIVTNPSFGFEWLSNLRWGISSNATIHGVYGSNDTFDVKGMGGTVAAFYAQPYFISGGSQTRGIMITKWDSGYQAWFDGQAPFYLNTPKFYLKGLPQSIVANDVPLVYNPGDSMVKTMSAQTAYYVYGNHTASSALPGWGLMNIRSINASGTPSASNYLRGDGTWATPNLSTIISSTTTLTTTYPVVVVSSSAATTQTLPASPTADFEITIINDGTGTVTVSGVATGYQSSITTKGAVTYKYVNTLGYIKKGGS